jgi:hypothetical protein
MIQVNMLLSAAGRASDSFVMNDLMRFPLGILTGVGFIGGGAILRRDTLVIGLTAAATLWLATVIGLCIGGGQILLGVISTVLGLFALWILKWVEGELRGEVRARLEIKYASDGPDETQLIHELQPAGLRILRTKTCVDRGNDSRGASPHMDSANLAFVRRCGSPWKAGRATPQLARVTRPPLRLAVFVALLTGSHMLFVRPAPRGGGGSAAGRVTLMALLTGLGKLLVCALLCGTTGILLGGRIFVALLASLHMLLMRAAARVLLGHRYPPW